MYIVYNRHNVSSHCVYWTCPLCTIYVYLTHFIGHNRHNYQTLFGNYCLTSKKDDICKKTRFSLILIVATRENGFSRISSKLSKIGQIFINNANINVVIPHLLSLN